jgi:hypothetical protein
MYNDEDEYTFEYTKEFFVSSSVIDAVYFNENESSVVLDVNDELYEYTGVDSFEVAKLVKGGNTGSIGNYYNTIFKTKFGPGKHLGYYNDWDAVEVPVEKNNSTPTTPKGLVYASTHTEVSEDKSTLTNVLDLDEPTKEYSLAPVATPDKERYGDGEPLFVNDEPTKEYSLATPDNTGWALDFNFDDEVPAEDDVKGIDGVREIVVHFTLDNFSDRKFKYTAESTSVEAAIEELNDYVSKMHARGRVRKVVVKFE